MLQFLRLHAIQDNFGHTVAKARRFAETHEVVRPKKCVRIVEAIDRDHNADVATAGQTPNFQPLLEGIEKIVNTVLSDRAQVASVTCVGNEQGQGREKQTSSRNASPA